MPIPSIREIQLPLLHLIHSMGGEAKPRDVYDKLGDYFGLSEKERQELLPCGNRKFDTRIITAANSLCSQGFLDRRMHGVWTITEKARRELSRLGWLDKPFPIHAAFKDQNLLLRRKGAEEPQFRDEELIELILQEVAPEGPKKFPEDFLDGNCSEFYEVELPGIELQLAPLSRTIITSLKGYFRYQAKNPPEAQYILYAHNVGTKKIRVPKDNLTLFKTVKAYEKYCDDVARAAFDLFLEFTKNENQSEDLTMEVLRRLNLKPTPSLRGNPHE